MFGRARALYPIPWAVERTTCWPEACNAQGAIIIEIRSLYVHPTDGRASAVRFASSVDLWGSGEGDGSGERGISQTSCPSGGWDAWASAAQRSGTYLTAPLIAGETIHSGLRLGVERY